MFSRLWHWLPDVSYLFPAFSPYTITCPLRRLYVFPPYWRCLRVLVVVAKHLCFILIRARPIVEMDGKLMLSTTQISLEDNKTVRLASDGISRQRYPFYLILYCSVILKWLETVVADIHRKCLCCSVNVTVCLKYKNQKQSSGKLCDKLND